MKTQLRKSLYYTLLVRVAKTYRGQKWCLNLIFFLLALSGFTQQKAKEQSYGMLKITVSDKKTKEPIPFATAVVTQADKVMAKGTSDLDGILIIKLIPSGKYAVKVAFIGYAPKQFNDVVIFPGRPSYLNVLLENDGVDLKTVEITEYKVDLIDADTKSGGTIDRESFVHMADKSISSVVSTETGVYSADPGSDISIRGSRSGTTTYFVDGERMIGTTGPAAAETNPSEPRLRYRAGKLTAGEINDFKKWNLWKEMGKEGMEQYIQVWNMEPNERYSVFVMDEKKNPVIDASAVLYGKDGKAIWSARTDNAGRAELWAGMFGKKAEPSYIEVECSGRKYKKDKIEKFGKGINLFGIPAVVAATDALDVMFVVDATGSMGDEIDYLKGELSDIISKASEQLPCMKINLGAVFYRDQEESYVTKGTPLSPKIGTTIDFIQEQAAAGGGDTPEAVEEALKKAVSETEWSEHAVARLMFLVLDAPPHDNDLVKKQIEEQITKAAAMGIHIIPLVASGMDKNGEYLMRSFALATNGTYVFLTDHSGIGGKHLKPTTDEYDVEYLNALILRLIKQFARTQACDPAASQQVKDTTVVIAHEILAMSEEKHKKGEIAKDPAAGNDTLAQRTTPIEKEIEKAFRFFPNPTPGKMNIEIEGGIHELFLSDVNGKFIERYEMSKGDNEIDIGNYPDGVYLLQCNDNGRWRNGKVVLLRK